MDGIIKSLNSYSLTQEKFEEMNNDSKNFKKGKKILSLLQKEKQKQLEEADLKPRAQVTNTESKQNKPEKKKDINAALNDLLTAMNKYNDNEK